MSPAGYWPQLRAAIEAGADAVYFGLDHFSARAKVGFQVDELKDVMATLHERGVKGFVTFNTLVFDTELDRAEKAIIEIASAGADAIIVQDVGVAQLAKQIAPNLEIHGSTQMSVTTAQGAELAKQFGCSRVVLGRELSINDIEKISKVTDVEIEVFVHGALCVSYSGQCFSSEAWGGRSANRGQCAQACRLSYDLFVDDKITDVGPYRYLLSPNDLYALEQVHELTRLGVSCLKIEGRYKDENYVALTTAAYRDAIDRAFDGRELEDTSQTKNDLVQIYSRGLEPAFISGINHQKVVNGRAPRHRGLLVGTVIDVSFDAVEVKMEHEIFPGDGLVFDAADWRSPDEKEEGGNVYQVDPIGKRKSILRFGRGEVDFDRIRDGDKVWRTNDPKLLQKIKKTAKAKAVLHSRKVDLNVESVIGQPLKVTAIVEGQEPVSINSEANLAPAQKRSLDRPQLVKQLGRLGGSPFHLGRLEISGDDQPAFLPVSQLNAIRRDFVDQLVADRKAFDCQTNVGVVQRWQEANPVRVEQTEGAELDPNVAKRLHLLVRNKEQLAAAIDQKPDSITLDYLELFGLRPSVDQVKEAGIVARVASPRVLKPSEQNISKFLLSLECEILVRSGGLLFDLLNKTEIELPNLIGDFSLNTANTVSAKTYLDLGLAAITPTYDLNGKQIIDLCQRIDPARIESIGYSHLPVFHTEHCLFCRFLSDGTDKSNCGQPCERHKVQIRDQRGRLHPVMADVGCRNTVFGAEAQFSARHLDNWVSASIQNFRLEFVHETPDQVAKISQLFSECLTSKISASTLETRLRSTVKTGLTEGSLFVPLVEIGSK